MDFPAILMDTVWIYQFEEGNRSWRGAIQYTNWVMERSNISVVQLTFTLHFTFPPGARGVVDAKQSALEQVSKSNLFFVYLNIQTFRVQAIISHMQP